MIEARTVQAQWPRVLRREQPQRLLVGDRPVGRAGQSNAGARGMGGTAQIVNHPRRWPTWMLAIAVGAIGAASLWVSLGREQRTALAGPSLLQLMDHALIEAGLGLDQVDVSGHRFTSDADILDAVDLPNVRSLAAVDSNAVRRRIERLPWVATASVYRVFPGTLRVAVSERSPFAVWDQSAAAVLIDASGRSLGTIANSTKTNLPRVAGDDAPEDAARLLALIAAIPELNAKLDVAERVASRRWRLRLTNGATIELPAEADAAALAMLIEERPGGRLLDINATTIDLSVPRWVSVRGLPPPLRGHRRE